MKKMIIFSAMMVWALTGCETPEDRKISEGQACLDGAKNSSDASACIQKVEGLETPEASRIRCGATYIQRNFTVTMFADAFKQIQSNSSNGDPVLSMMMNLKFSGASSVTGRSASSDADYVYSECKKSLSTGLTLLGAATKTGTDVGTAFAACNTPSTLANCISGSTADATLGSVAVTLSTSYCTGSAAESDVCKQIKLATASGGSEAAIGAALRAYLNTPGTSN